MSIFRDTFQKDIKTSLENRQKAMTRRSTEDIQYLNSRNSWIRMTSAVNTDPTNSNPSGSNTLAKQYILHGGSLEHQKGNYTLRKGIGSGGEEVYSTQTPLGKDYRLGLRPMPGITSVEVKSKSAYGSLREAVVNFQCWDVAQLEDLELLYMRPGYTVLVEWGWTPYLDTNGRYQPTFIDFYSNDIINATSKNRSDIFKKLYNRCTKYGGNYDAIYGYVKNYQWSARNDGGYDCSTTIISTGEVIESIKVNYVRSDLATYGMYNTGSVGAGFLDELFNPQGATKSTTFAEYYQKNTLAGIWAELNYKLKDSSARVSSYGGTILGYSGSTKYRVLDLPGLTNYGNLDTFIEPSSRSKVYITVEAAFDIMNKYILAKPANDSEPLVKLTTKTETYSGKPSTDLLCVGHPIQISVDPTVCMIKSPLWYDEIAPSITTATSGVASTATTSADAIVKELIDASEGVDVDMTKFLAAVAKITDPITYAAVNDTFIKGTYSNSTSINTSENWTFTSGFQGLLQEQFIDKRDQLDSSQTQKSNWKGSIYPHTGYIMGTWYLYRISRTLPAGSGITLSIGLTPDDPADGATTFKDILALPANNGKEATFDISKDFPGKLLELKDAKGRDFGGVGGLGNVFWTIANYKLGSVSLSAPTAAATTATALVLNTADAVGIINQMERLDQYFFTDKVGEEELGIIGNIYVSLDFLYRQSLNANLEASDTKEKSEINLYSYIKGVMSGIQISIGNLNNFEVHVDPIDNKARVIDVNYTEKTKPTNLFELQVQNLNSVVRSYTLQSQIFPNQSSIIAIGSQQQAGQSGIQNKTMTSFNTGLVDRILGDKVDPKGNRRDPASMAAALAGIIVLYSTLGYQIQPTQVNNLNINEYISRAKNSLRDLIVYFQTTYYSPGANRNILPFKFSFEMDGIGGLVIGSLFKVNEDIIPKGYRGRTAGVNLAQTVTSISHTISNSDWTTKIDALNIILDRLPKGNFKGSAIKGLVNTAVQAIINAGLGLGLPATGVGSPPSGGGPGGSFFGASGGKDCGRVPKYNLLANIRGTLTRDQIVNQLKTAYSSDLKMLARVLIIGTLEQGLMTKPAGSIVYGGNFNYFGIQGDLAKWTDPSGYIIGAHEDKEGSTNCRRYFVSFGSLENAARFMEFQLNRKGIGTAATADEITELYISKWWSPSNKASIIADKSNPSGKYQEKLKIVNSAIRNLSAYGISL